jgi:hypothetical protein
MSTQQTNVKDETKNIMGEAKNIMGNLTENVDEDENEYKKDNEKKGRLGILSIFGIFMVITVGFYGLYRVLYGSLLYDATKLYEQLKTNAKLDFGSRFFSRLLIVFVATLISILTVIIIKIVAFDKKPNPVFFIREFMYNGLLFFFMYGFSMVSIGAVPLLPRIFENTLGYMANSGNALKQMTSRIFENRNNPKDNQFIDYSVMITPFYVENFLRFLNVMRPEGASSQRGGEETSEQPISTPGQSNSTPEQSNSTPEQSDSTLQPNPFGAIQIQQPVVDWLNNFKNNTQPLQKGGVDVSKKPKIEDMSIDDVMKKFYEKVVAKRRFSEIFWMLMTTYMAFGAAII